MDDRQSLNDENDCYHLECFTIFADCQKYLEKNMKRSMRERLNLFQSFNALYSIRLNGLS